MEIVILSVNNIFKLILVGKRADKQISLHFGIYQKKHSLQRQ
jgi:hypothetical protein